MAKNEIQRQPLPPYVSFKTFEGFIQKLHDTAVPERVDTSLLRSYSGSVGRQLIATLKYLGLIEDSGRVTGKLEALAKSYGTSEWQQQVGDTISDAYVNVVGDLNLDVATHGQLVEKFKAQGADGQVLQKCVAFYIAALRNAGLTFSPYIAERPRGRPARRSKTREGIEEQPAADTPQPQPGTVRFSFPIPDKSPATIFLPADLAGEDWEMIDNMVRAYIARRQKT